MKPNAAYRRDIDGLRAIAVVPVLAFHAHVPGFSGGFVGVDIFFVISGFLITSIIAREVDAGQFSLIRFYERRARRVLPALMVVLAFVLAMASWLYLPDDFAAVPRSALMVLLFLSNLWFFLKVGYFGGGAETMPLLHCWSLAVEEQFYIAFPILLRLIANRTPRFRLYSVATITAVSFAWALLKQADTDGFAFYMLPPRAWELLVGGLLALAKWPDVRSPVVRNGLALGGMGLILLSVFSYDKATVFPGLTALAPVLGAALLIQCAPGTLMGRLLATRPLVGIGLISYSLYLWHWPLIVFVNYAGDKVLHGPIQVAVIVCSIIIAWASWRYVERPFRDSRQFSQRRIFMTTGWAMAAVGLLSLLLMLPGGWNSRFSPQANHLIAASHDISPKRGMCITRRIGGARPECNLGAQVSPQAILWGDSHGVEFAWIIGQHMARQNQSLMERTHSSCAPVIGYTVAIDPGCARFNAEVMTRIMASPQIRTVYLAAFWALSNYNQPGMIGKVDATIKQLQTAGKNVIIIGPVPSQPFNVPRRLAHAAIQGNLDAVQGASLEDYKLQTNWFTSSYARWRAHGVIVIDPIISLAEGDHTRLQANGKPLYADSHHISLSGAEMVITRSGNF